MIYIILFVIGVVIDIVVAADVHSTKFEIGSFVVGTVILLLIVGIINSVIRNHIDGINEIDELKKNKETYKSELEALRKGADNELLAKCKEFEESIMGYIKDSNILATVMEDSAYCSIVKQYNNDMLHMVAQEHATDRSINNIHKKLLAGQERNLFTFGWFIPKHLRIDKEI